MLRTNLNWRSQTSIFFQQSTSYLLLLQSLAFEAAQLWTSGSIIEHGYDYGWRQQQRVALSRKRPWLTNDNNITRKTLIDSTSRSSNRGSKFSWRSQSSITKRCWQNSKSTVTVNFLEVCIFLNLYKLVDKVLRTLSVACKWVTSIKCRVCTVSWSTKHYLTCR